MGSNKPAPTNNQTAVKEGFSASLSISSLDDVARAADMIYKSGAFQSLNNPQEAGAKIMAGLELGLSPMTSVRNIYFFDGQVTLSGPIIAALIRQHPNYDYRIMGANTEGAKVRFYRREVVDGEEKMVAQEPDVMFTQRMAENAGLLSKQNWKDYPEDMYVWRCIARGKRWHCPEVGNGTLYIPDEAKNGPVEDVEPIEEIKTTDSSEEDAEAKGLPESSTAEEAPDAGEVQGTPKETPDFDEKKETTETKAPDPDETQGVPDKPDDAEDRRKPLRPNGNGTEADTGESEESAPNEVEEAANRREALIPSFVSVNVGAITDEAAQRIQSIQQTLRTMDTGNSLLTSIKSYREEVEEDYPNEADADRVALEEVLDHHLNRIGTGPDPETDSEGDSSGDSGEDEGRKRVKPEQTEIEGAITGEMFDFPWFDSIGRKFRTDMEKSAEVLERAKEKGGITPLKKRLSEIKARFEDAGTTPQMDREFERLVMPYETVLSMREALIGPGDPEFGVFEDVISDFMEESEDLSPSRRLNRAREVVTSEANRLESEFESLSVEVDSGTVEADGKTPDGSGDSADEGEEESGPKVPDFPLPPGFPKREKLQNAGVKRTGGVVSRLREETLTEIKGIGEASVGKIKEYLSEIIDEQTEG